MLPAFKWETLPCPGLTKHIYAPYMHITCFFFPFPFLTGELQAQLDDDDDDDDDTSNTKSSRLILQDSMMMDTTCLFDPRIDWWLHLIILLLLFVTLFPTRHMTGSPTCIQDYNTTTHYLLPWLLILQDKTILQDLHISLITLLPWLQCSNIPRFSSPPLKVVLHWFSRPYLVYTSLFRSILVLQGSLKAILFWNSYTLLNTSLNSCYLSVNVSLLAHSTPFAACLISHCSLSGSIALYSLLLCAWLGFYCSFSTTTLSDMMHYWYLCYSILLLHFQHDPRPQDYYSVSLLLPWFCYSKTNYTTTTHDDTPQDDDDMLHTHSSQLPTGSAGATRSVAVRVVVAISSHTSRPQCYYLLLFCHDSVDSKMTLYSKTQCYCTTECFSSSFFFTATMTTPMLQDDTISRRHLKTTPQDDTSRRYFRWFQDQTILYITSLPRGGGYKQLLVELCPGVLAIRCHSLQGLVWAGGAASGPSFHAPVVPSGPGWSVSAR